MPIELPRGLPFAVDTWTPASAVKRHRFLTHAHRDHLTGIAAAAVKRHRFLTHAHRDHLTGIAAAAATITITSSAAVYVSRLTVLIARHIFPQLAPDAFVEMELGAPVLVADPDGDFTVTAFDANHCPGAVMFLFEGAFGSVLHTGDCRLTPGCIQGLPLRYITADGPGAPPSCRIDYLFLDCTFARCPLQFPTPEASIRQVINCIWDHPNAPVVYLVSDMLGQEEILIEVSRVFGSKIYVDRDKNSDCHHNLSLVAPHILTEDTSSRFRVMEFPRLSERAEEMLALARAKQLPEPLIIRPSSQWYAHFAPREVSPMQKPVLTVPMRDDFGVWHVCFSMHSSREELEQALRFLQPKWVISTTPPCVAMDLSYVKKHCVLSRLGPNDTLWKLLGISYVNDIVTSSLEAVVKTVEAIKESGEEAPCSFICSQVLQDKEPTKENFEMQVVAPVTLFGRARFGLPQDCSELWKCEYESAQGIEEVQFEAEGQNSGTESSELWKDGESVKGVVEVVDLTQIIPEELHDPATEPLLWKDSESEDEVKVIDITEAEVKENTDSDLWKNEKCNEHDKRIGEAKFEVREQNSIDKARESVEFIIEEQGCTVVSEIGKRSKEAAESGRGASSDSLHGTGLGSSSNCLNATLRKLYRSMNVPVPRPLPSLVELMRASKRPRTSSQILHL